MKMSEVTKTMNYMNADTYQTLFDIILQNGEEIKGETMTSQEQGKKIQEAKSRAWARRRARWSAWKAEQAKKNQK